MSDKAADSSDKLLVSHLSDEINTTLNNLTTFRSRFSFTLLIGPFLVLAAVIATVRDGARFSWSSSSWTPAIFMALSYLSFAVFAAYLDCYIGQQCNTWRKAIMDLCNGREVSFDQIKFKHETWVTVAMYVVVYVIALVNFGSVIWLLFTLVP